MEIVSYIAKLFHVVTGGAGSLLITRPFSSCGAGFPSPWLLLLPSVDCGCSGFSRCGTLAPYLRSSQALEHWAGIIVAHGFSCSAACRLFLDQGVEPFSLVTAEAGFFTSRAMRATKFVSALSEKALNKGNWSSHYKHTHDVLKQGGCRSR